LFRIYSATNSRVIKLHSGIPAIAITFHNAFLLRDKLLVRAHVFQFVIFLQLISGRRLNIRIIVILLS
jgi:hypothetical protein